MKKYINILLAIGLIFGLGFSIFTADITSLAGTETFESEHHPETVTSDGYFINDPSGSDATWAEVAYGDATTIYTDSVGLAAQLQYWTTGWGKIEDAFISFDISGSLTSDSIVDDGYVRFYGTSKSSDIHGTDDVVLVTGWEADDYADVDEYDRTTNYPTSFYLGSDDEIADTDWSTVTWNTFNLNAVGMAWVEWCLENNDGIVPWRLMFKSHAEDDEPDWADGSEVVIIVVGAESSDHASGHDPEMYLEWKTPTGRDADIPSNPATGSGSGAITSIDFYSPRCAFADEDVAVRVQGAEGEPITLYLQSPTGQIIDQITDEMRVGDVFYWLADLDNYNGWFLITEEEGITSDWGYSAISPDTDMPSNSTWTRNSTYPQYYQDFEIRMRDENDVCIWFYSTDLEYTDFADFEFEIWYEGDNSSPTYDETLENLADNYFDLDWTGADTNEHMVAYRYILTTFDMPSGFDDRDGLILDLNLVHSSTTAGMYQPVIYETGVSEYTDTITAFWYMEDTDDPITYQLNDINFDLMGIIETYTGISGDSRATDSFDTITASLYNSSDVIQDTDNDTLVEGVNQIDLTAAALSGSYYVEFKLSESGISYDEIHRVNLGIGSGGGGGSGDTSGLIESIEGGLSTWGILNDFGYWLLIIVGMVIMFYIFQNVPILKWVAPSLVLVGGIIAGWVDPWIVILCALSVGVGIYIWVRNRVLA